MLYIQWFLGKDNIVSDCLSRDLHLLPTHLTQIITSIVTHQLPRNFRIVQLPPTITFWISSLLARIPVRMERQIKYKTSEIEHDVDVPLSSLKSASKTTPASLDSPNHGSESSSFPYSHKPCKKQATQASLSLPWLEEKSVPLLTMWHRPPGLTIA